MATIFDDIPIIQETNQQDNMDTFIGYNRIVSITADAKAKEEEEKRKQQQDWMLTTVENTIKKAAEESYYSTTIIVPIEYDINETMMFLQQAGYSVRQNQSGSRNLTVSWEVKDITLNLQSIIYTDFDTSIGGSDFTTITVPKGTLYNQEFIEQYFPESNSITHLEGFTEINKAPINNFSSYKNNIFVSTSGWRTLTPLNTYLWSNMDVVYPYDAQ